MYYLHKSAACLAAYPEKGLSCAPALRWVRVLWPTLSERRRRVTWLCWLGCIGKARVPNPSPFPLVVGFSLPESVGNRRRVGVSVAVSVLVTLLVRFGGDELGSGLRVCRQSCRWWLR